MKARGHLGAPGHQGLPVQHGQELLHDGRQALDARLQPARELRHPDRLVVHLSHLDHEPAGLDASITIH